MAEERGIGGVVPLLMHLERQVWSPSVSPVSEEMWIRPTDGDRTLLLVYVVGKAVNPEILTIFPFFLGIDNSGHCQFLAGNLDIVNSS